MAKRSGAKSLAQTPAPAKDRIKGSKVNPKGSASSEASASKIKLDAKTLTALTNKLKEFKESHPNSKNITLADLKAVYRRGAGAYSTSHRPTITGGKPNTRNAWAMARVNKFLLKAGGTKVKKAYVQDDDLMKMHLGGDMSKHLAPNGKPSNLTHEQWHLVRTPEFKAWFGDWENNPKKASKVVDENGEPMVLYRGWASNRNFGNVFNYNVNLFGSGDVATSRKKNRFGFYFTTNYLVAKEYAKAFADDYNLNIEYKGLKKTKAEPIVQSYFLNIKNVFDLTDTNSKYPKVEDLLNNYNLLIKKLYNELPTKQRSKEIFNSLSTMYGTQIGFKDLCRIVGIKKDEFIENEELNKYYEWNDANPIYKWFINRGDDSDLLIKGKLISQGYNGIFFKENTGYYETLSKKEQIIYDKNFEKGIKINYPKVFVAFEPNQIKLADGTNTTFDSSNPDIRYADGGELQFEDIDFDNAIKQFRIVTNYGDDDRYLTSKDKKSLSLKRFYADKKLKKIIGFDIGNLPSLSENQKKIRNKIYELSRNDRYADGGEVEFTNNSSSNNAIILKSILDKSQIPYSYKLSHIWGSQYWTINGNNFRVSDHSKNENTITNYKKDINDFRSYKDFYNKLKSMFDLTDKTELERQFKEKIIINKDERGYYVLPNGAVYDDLNNAKDRLWREHLENIYPKNFQFKDGGEVDDIILNNVIKQVSSPFTKEVLPFAIIPANKNQFVVSVVNVRGGKEILLDYYFTKKTGKLVKTETISINDSKYKDGGDLGQEIRCRRCNHKWNTNQSNEHDKYVCHKCGFDNTTYYDKDVLGFDNGGYVYDDDYYEEDIATLSDLLIGRNKLEKDKRYILSEDEEIKFRNVKQDDKVTFKPKGLWYAIGSGWAEFLIYGLPERSKDANNLHEIEVTDRVLKLNTIEEAVDFSKKYGFNSDFGTKINWELVEQDWSGIEIANPYEWCRIPQYENGLLYWMYTWDVASGCVWKEDGIKSIEPLVTNFNYINGEYSWDDTNFKLKNGGMTDKYEISDYWETESFADGGLVKTKSIITDKIGWNESVADWFIEQDSKLAIWLADGFMKYHLGKNLLPENTSKEFKEKYGIDISNKPKKEEWDSLPMSIKKTLINELYSNSTMFFRYGEIYENTGLTRADNQVRLILDWIKHPITPKQDLKNLSITEALQKAKEWHEELVAIGGDIDFTEPEENEIFIKYPKDKDGAEFYWVKIPSNFCSLESSRMGHCGRTGYGNTLISLRSIRPYGKGHTINDSHVTIAYNEKDGIFYQTKGKKNQKPAEKYHDYIFDLVKTLAQEDRHIRIDGLVEKQNKLIDESEKLSNIKDDLKLDDRDLEIEYNKLIKVLDSVKSKREYDAITNRINEIEKERNELGDKIRDIFNESRDIADKMEANEGLRHDIKKMYRYAFGGFGAEYGSEEDYGFGEMTDEQVKELYEINPSLFSNLGGRLTLYNRGIVEEKPDTTFILEKDVKYIDEFFQYDGNKDFLRNVIRGEMYDVLDLYVDKDDVLNYYLDDLNEKNMSYVIAQISNITNIPIEEVVQNGAEYYLSGDYMDESDEEYDFDSIIDAIRRAVTYAMESDAYKYYYGEIKSALSELGEVLNLNDEGIKVKIDLSNLLTTNQIESYSKEFGDRTDTIFFEAEYRDDIEFPRLRFDDRFSPSADAEQINEYFEPDFYDKGGVVRSKRLGDSTYEYKGFYIVKWDGGQSSFWNIWRDAYATDEIAIGFRTKKDAMEYLDKYADSLNKNLDRYKDGGEVDEHKETYAKWKTLVNMSKSELENFYNSDEGKEAGLSKSEAKSQGISSGRESARWVMKMKDTPVADWTPMMWKWANKQISFISRMSGMQGELYDDKGNKTRKHTSLLIWGHNPKKNTSMKYNKGGETEINDFAKKSKFKVSKSNDYIFFNINADKQIRITKVGGKYNRGYRVTLHQISEDGITYKSEYLINDYASDLQDAKKVAGKIYFDVIREGASEEIDIDDKDFDYSKIPTDELKKMREKTNDFSEMASIVKELNYRKNNPDIRYEDGGIADVRMEDTVQRMDNPNFADISYYDNGGLIVDGINIDEAVKQFRIAYETYDDSYLTSRERKSNSLKQFYARKRLEKILGFDMGDLYRMTERQREIRDILYERMSEIRKNEYNNGGTINSQINTNIMDNVRFNQLPHIDTISEGDSILIHESVFSGNINKPKHVGERYIHCKAMSKGGMLNTLNLEVIKSVGANPFMVGQTITRPIGNIMTKGRKLIVEPITETLGFKDGGMNDLYIGDEISYKGSSYEVGGMTDCKGYVKVKDSKSGETKEVGVDEILDNSRLIKRK